MPSKRRWLRALFQNLFGANFIGNIAGNAFTKILSFFHEGAAAVLSFSARLEQAHIGFTTLLRSSRAADAHLKDLKKFAAETPFEFPELLQASRRMHALQIETKDVIPLLTDVGNAVAAMGGSSENVQLVVKALTDIKARGKVAAEELNQLSDQGIGGVQLLSKELNKTSAEVLQMAERGEISADTFIKAFQKFSRENFGGAMEKQSKTFLGSLSTIKDKLLDVGSTAFEPFYKSISELTVRTAREIEAQDFEGTIQIFENAFRAAGRGAAQAGIDIINELFDGAERQADKRQKNSTQSGWGKCWRKA